MGRNETGIKHRKKMCDGLDCIVIATLGNTKHHCPLYTGNNGQDVGRHCKLGEKFMIFMKHLGAALCDLDDNDLPKLIFNKSWGNCEDIFLDLYYLHDYQVFPEYHWISFYKDCSIQSTDHSATFNLVSIQWK